MIVPMRSRPLRSHGESVVRPVATMSRVQVAACSVSLLAAGVLLTHGFIGFVPGRPVFVVLGVVLAATAVAGLAFDHVSVQSISARPDHVVMEELNRCRRGSHSLTLMSVRCSAEVGDRIIRRMRCEDRAWRQRGRLELLLVETDRVQAEAFLQRLADLVQTENVRMASFPEDAVTIDDLYACLRAPQSLGQPIVEPTVEPVRLLELVEQMPESGIAAAEG